MTLPAHLGTLSLWMAHPVLQAAVAAMLWRRGLHKKFPVFFTYILAQIVIFSITFPLREAGNYEWFFWFYWLGATASAILGFKVIHEVFLDVFRPYHTLKDLGTVLFKWAGVVMLMVSAVVAFSNSNDHGPVVHAVTTLQRSVRMVQCGLILFLLLFSRFLGVSKRQHSFGIALGFGFYASVELILVVLASGGFATKIHIDVMNMIAYNLAIGVWLGYTFLHSAAAETVVVNQLQTQRWEASLADLHAPAAGGITSDSLIPMFEGMVERAFSRNANSSSLQDSKPAPSRPAGSALPSLPAAAAAAGSKGRS